jgi:uncharacterized membrane protein
LAGAEAREIFASWLVDVEALRNRNVRGSLCQRERQGTMEFLNLLIIVTTAWLVWRRPEKERLAFRLLVVSCLLMALLFLIGTHGSLVPGVNL